MSTKLIDETHMSDIADAIRIRAGTSDPIAVGDMAQAIIDIPGGGSTAIFDSIYETQEQHQLAESDFSVIGTKIRNYAFADDLLLNELHLPSGITTIGKYAFQDAFTNLDGSRSNVYLPDTITELQDYAFNNTSGTLTTYMIINLYCYATTPPTIGTKIFNQRRIFLHVPSASLSSYKSAWTASTTGATALSITGDL